MTSASTASAEMLRGRDGCPSRSGEVEGKHIWLAEGAVAHVGVATEEEHFPTKRAVDMGTRAQEGGATEGASHPLAQAAEWHQRGEGLPAATPPVCTLHQMCSATYGVASRTRRAASFAPPTAAQLRAERSHKSPSTAPPSPWPPCTSSRGGAGTSAAACAQRTGGSTPRHWMGTQARLGPENCHTSFR